MLRTINRRYPLVDVVLAPTAVQGDEAPAGILSAIESMNQIVKPDVILLARGGGSIEDLRAFNHEGVARAIAASPAPVITGIGHETDFTIADFAADLRAATPTAAAELATPDQADLRGSLSDLSQENLRVMQLLFQARRAELDRSQNFLLSRTPLARVHRDRQRLDELNSRVGIALAHTLEIDRTRLAGLELRLRTLNPQAILERGFSILTLKDGSSVRSVQQVQPGDDLQVRVSDGEFGARVQDPGNAEKNKT
jgi:exodeoxyribonuclease VII large subunit